jgi:hypothetical protein
MKRPAFASRRSRRRDARRASRESSRAASKPKTSRRRRSSSSSSSSRFQSGAPVSLVPGGATPGPYAFRRLCVCPRRSSCGQRALASRACAVGNRGVLSEGTSIFLQSTTPVSAPARLFFAPAPWTDAPFFTTRMESLGVLVLSNGVFASALVSGSYLASSGMLAGHATCRLRPRRASHAYVTTASTGWCRMTVSAATHWSATRARPANAVVEGESSRGSRARRLRHGRRAWKPTRSSPAPSWRTSTGVRASPRRGRDRRSAPKWNAESVDDRPRRSTRAAERARERAALVQVSLRTRTRTRLDSPVDPRSRGGAPASDAAPRSSSSDMSNFARRC